MRRVVKHVIAPEMIKTSEHFFGTFGNMETEVTARILVEFFQKRGKGWEPFRKKELDEFAGEDFWFNKLDNGINTGYVQKNNKGQYFVTHEFICVCYTEFPANL